MKAVPNNAHKPSSPVQSSRLVCNVTDNKKMFTKVFIKESKQAPERSIKGNIRIFRYG